jgi:hypothetical protein
VSGCGQTQSPITIDRPSVNRNNKQKVKAYGAPTHTSAWWEHRLRAADLLAESLGCRLLAACQAISTASRGYLPCPVISPRRLGIGGGVLGAMVLLSLLLVVWRGVFSPKAPDVSAANIGRTEARFIVSCEKCGWQRPIDAAELRSAASRNGAYCCEKCRAFTAYPESVGKRNLANGGRRGVQP